MLQLNTVHHGDARQLLPEISDNAISLSIWSPPYHVGKAYEKDISYIQWSEMLYEVIALHYRILKPGSFLVVNIADILCFPDPNMPRIQAPNKKRQRQDITKEIVLQGKEEHPELSRYQLAKLLGCSEQTIDRRLNGNNIRGGKYMSQTRVHLVGNLIEDAGNKAGLYLYDRRIWVKDASWENSKWHTLSYRSVDEFEYLYFFWKPGETVVDRDRLSSEEWGLWGSRGVWHIPSVRTNDNHEAKFPLEIPRRIIQLLTDPGEIVLDCFMGSGTTAIAAIQENRVYLGVELDRGYAEMANEACRIEERRLLSTRLHENNGDTLKDSVDDTCNEPQQLKLIG